MNDAQAGPTELAPSNVRTAEPSFARAMGAIGLSFALLGTIAVIANQYGPRFVGTAGGYIFAALGMALMIFHALRDGDIEFRRAYNLIGGVFLLAALVAGVAPGPIFSDAISKYTGYHLLPWTPLFSLAGLAFLAAPLRHEAIPSYRNSILLLLLAIGAALTIGSVAFGIARPETLIGPGLLMALVGLAFLATFLSFVDHDDGLGRFVAMGLGVAGAAVVTYALTRSIWPTVLADGPAALKNAFQRIDIWKAAARAIAVAAFAAIAVWGVRGRSLHGIARLILVAFGASFAGVLAYAAFASAGVRTPKPFLIPTGLILTAIGLAYLCVAIGTVSDRPLITLVRRELAAYFFSPIAWFVIVGMAMITWLGYMLFIGVMMRPDNPEMQEPILSNYYAGSFLGPLAILVLIPAITMRMFAEEKRSGTLEVLLTAPISESTVLASKMISAWLFYMTCWIPMGLYLIALRVEGGQPFDYRPLLSLYIAIGVSGFAFVAMGAFFSSITNNQIVAAVLTFVVLISLFALRWHEYFPIQLESVRSTLTALAAASYSPFWENALSGQLLVRDMMIQFSLGVFWTYLTLKSLDVRKWG